MPACCCDQHGERQRAHARAGARAVGDVDQRRRRGSSAAAPARPARRRWKPRGGTSSTPIDERRRAPARCAIRDFSARGDRRRRRRGRDLRLAGAAAVRRRCAPGASAAHRRLDLPDVLRRRPAAAADEAHAAVDEAPRVRRHVLGRAEIDVAPFDLARLAGVGLRRQLDRASTLGHPLDRFEHRRGADAAVQPDDVRAARARARARTPPARAPSRLLPSSSVVICATIGRSQTLRTARIAAPISLTSRKVSSTNRSTPPSSSASRLLAEDTPRASSTPVLPHGSMRMPSGPIAPAT